MMWGHRTNGTNRDFAGALPQTLLPGYGYDAGVKKPVAVPKK
jgi:hypothetical protein